MSVLDLIPAPIRPWAVALVLLVIAAASAGGAWVVQDWRYGKTLADKATQAATEAQSRVEVVLAQLTTEQGKRAALEGRLKANEETHYRELSDGNKAQQRLADRLATSDVRLSVLIAAGVAPSSGDGLSASAGTSGLVHGATRAELDPAHAQRIIRITGDGDDGLIALKACQGYVQALWEARQTIPPP